MTAAQGSEAGPAASFKLAPARRHRWEESTVDLFIHPESAPGDGGRSGKVREPILAGQWYEANPTVLAADIDGHLSGGGRPPVALPDDAAVARAWAGAGRHPVAVIVPHAGHAYSGSCAGETFELLRGSRFRRVLLTGPSHQFGFSGAALPEEDAFRTPLGVMPIDTEAVQTLLSTEGFHLAPRAHAREHCLEIELPFLQKILNKESLLVPVVIGRLSGETLPAIAGALGRLWDEETVWVVSSDFTHYGPNYEYVPFLDEVPERLRGLDMEAITRIRALDREGFESYLRSREATICGAEPIRVLLEAARARALSVRLVEYYRSGDLNGDFRNSVSYAGLAFFETRPGDEPTPSIRAEETLATEGPRALTEDEERDLLRLARETVSAWAAGEPLPHPSLEHVPGGSPLREERGVFVTLNTSEGRLRGCIGSIMGESPLLHGVIRNAVASAGHDPRFPPIEPDEVPGLRIEISVLTPLREVAGPEEIVIGRDGVVLEKGDRRAVFLPQVAPEQGWDVRQMLRHLAMKAGLAGDDWQSGARFLTFEAQVFEEEAPATRPPE